MDKHPLGGAEEEEEEVWVVVALEVVVVDAMASTSRPARRDSREYGGS